MRNKAVSIINLSGLAIGIATCLIIMLFVQNELSYDRFHEKADRIVRVVFRGIVQGQKMNEGHVMPPVAQALKRDFPEVEEATRLRAYGSPRVSYGENSFTESAFAFVDSNFFQVFSLPFIKGDKKTALTKPNTIVITSEIAEKYFGQDNPMGKVLHFKDQNAFFTITGVIEKIPDNSHFHFDLLASMSGLPEAREQSWMVSEFYTYLVLPGGYDYKKLEAKLPEIVEKYMGPQLQQAMGISLDRFRREGNDIGLYLQPLTDIHLRANTTLDLEPGGNIQLVYIFSAIALFMLLIACINFMNLSTAGASKRAKEVGVRKILGSLRGQLIRKFLTESILLSLLALGLGILLVLIALPFFNELSGKTLNFHFSDYPWLLPVLLLFGLITGILAGSYPAFFLSSFRPLSVLKGRFSSRRNSISLRSGLVVFQFIISVTLMVSTAVVYRQLSYIRNKELGYNKDQVLILPDSWMLGKNQHSFRQSLLNDSRVLHVSVSGYLPAGPSYNNNFFVYEKDVADQIKTIRYDVDENYIPALGIQLMQGRNFSSAYGTDSSGIILNETAAKALGWEKNTLGKIIQSANNQGAKTTYQVIGVVKDFHFRSMHEQISPLVMVLGENAGTLIAKVNTTDIPGLLSSVKKHWDESTGGSAFNYSFLDDRFNATWKMEQKTGLILGIFSGLTIFVSCLGLFGLATFTAEQRLKEIGIRKVLGASVTNIVKMLSLDFLKLVLFATIIAWPIGWIIMNRWLEDYAYRITISVWVFAFTGAAAIFITILTISLRTIKAALANPVESLRTE